ncbi:AAA family ATPase [archaeon]|nr:AAA family ATPase [archaeon]
MLLEKYEPKTVKEMVGNTLQVSEVKKWLLGWKKGALIVTGPTGCGKDIALKLIAKEFGYTIIKHGIEESNVDSIVASCKEGSVFAGKRIIVLENIEFIRSKKTLTKLFDETKTPVIILLDNIYDQTLRNIIKNFKTVKFSKPNETIIGKFLSGVCRNENMNLTEKEIQAIARNSCGDVRAALIDLDMYNRCSVIESRTKTKNIFETLKEVFTVNDSRVLDNYSEYDMLFAWIDENIQKEYKNVGDVARAYDYLAKADRFRSLIIKRQSWSLQKYLPDMFVYGLPKKRLSSGFYAPPSRQKSPDSAVIRKAAAALHVSKRGLIDSMDLIKMFLSEKEFLDGLGITDEEAEVLKNY